METDTSRLPNETPEPARCSFEPAPEQFKIQADPDPPVRAKTAGLPKITIADWTLIKEDGKFSLYEDIGQWEQDEFDNLARDVRLKPGEVFPLPYYPDNVFSCGIVLKDMAELPEAKRKAGQWMRRQLETALKLFKD